MAPRGAQAHAPTNPNHFAAFTPKQNHQIFEIYHRKAEEERAAAAREHTFKIECMQRESEARIAATFAAAAAAPIPAPAPAAPQTIGGDDDILGEIPEEVQNLTLRFAGLPQEEIVKIFHNCFKPINLYRLRHMRDKSLHDQERIGIEDGMLRRKTSGTYKEFGSSFYDVWSESFHNYKTIMISLFTANTAELDLALNAFYGNILQLSQVYDWQKAVLPFAIEVHMHIISLQPSDPTKWAIPPEFQGRFCNPLTLLGSTRMTSQIKHKRLGSLSGQRAAKQPGGPSTNPSVICEIFNKGSCTWANCERAHKCKSCGSIPVARWCGSMVWLCSVAVGGGVWLWGRRSRRDLSDGMVYLWYVRSLVLGTLTHLLSS